MLNKKIMLLGAAILGLVINLAIAQTTTTTTTTTTGYYYDGDYGVIVNSSFYMNQYGYLYNLNNLPTLVTKYLYRTPYFDTTSTTTAAK